MPYQSLYRKHRPQRFSEVVGQDHVTSALRNSVKDGRVGHAYLFSGPRGTGKTTSARILAKALNCLDLQGDGEPCGKCENCVAVADGRFLDLFELDAASNNSVDNIRDLTDSVHLGLGPTSTRKVYLVDEVHMLSAAASNALLKTLEEPPAHVVFILATTNPEKVLPTIRSRTQHFEFTLLSTDELESRLADVLKREDVDADPEALAVIARVAAGSARDAESLADQALAHGTGRLETKQVTELFAGTPFELRARVFDAIASEDSAAVLLTLGEMIESGHEPRRVAEDLLRAARDGFLLTAGGGQVPIEAPADEAERLQELGDALGPATLVRVLETLGQAVVDMRGTDAADPRLVLEIALVRLTRRDAGPPLQTVIERIERLERAVAEGSASTGGADAPPARSAPGTTIGALRAQRSEEKRAATERPEGAEELAQRTSDNQPTKEDAGDQRASERERAATKPLQLDDVVLAWGQILPSLPVATRSAVQEAQPMSIDNDVITFAVPPRVIEAARPRFKREADNIREALSERLGRRMRFNLVPGDVLEGASEAMTEAGAASEASGASERGERAEEEEEHIDPAETTPADEASDTVSLLTDGLGATVVEERPRE